MNTKIHSTVNISTHEMWSYVRYVYRKAKIMQLRNFKIIYIQTFSRQHQTYKTIQVKISYILSFTIKYIALSACLD